MGAASHSRNTTPGAGLEHAIVIDQDGWIVGICATLGEATQRAKLLNSMRMTGPLGLTRSFKVVPVSNETHHQASMRHLLVWREGDAS